MTDNLIDEATIRKFLDVLHARAADALSGYPTGVLHLCSLVPDGPIRAQAFNVGDVDGMAKTALLEAEAGRNVYVEGRTIMPGRPEERGRANATIGVFALVIDRDADRGKAGRQINGGASVVVETSPNNVHEWLFLERALNASAAKTIGDAIRKAAGADHCSGVVTGCYRLPGTPNLVDEKKRARGRVITPTRLLHVTDRVWSADDLNAAFTISKLKPVEAQPARKATSASNGKRPIRSTTSR